MNVGQNVDMNVKGDVLTITVNLAENFGRSKSGKSLIIASTSGNKTAPGHDEIKIGLNVYKSA